MQIQSRRLLSRYGLVPVAIGVALLLRWLLWPILGTDYPFLLFWPAVMLCAWYGGVLPGLLATLLAATSATYLLLEPQYSFAIDRPTDVVGLTVFVLLSSGLAMLCEWGHQAHGQAALEGERLRVTLAGISDGVIVTDRQGFVTFLNPGAQALTGCEPDQCLGQPLDAVFRTVHAGTGQLTGSIAREALDAGKAVSLADDAILLGSKGGQCPVEGSAVPLRDSRGLLAGLVLTFHDLTERRRAEQVLQASEQLFKTLIEKTGGVMTLLDAGGTILYASPATTQALGCSPDELIGRNALDLIHPDDLPAASAMLTRLVQVPGDSQTITLRFRHGKGDWRWLEGTATNLLEDPSVRALVTSFHNMPPDWSPADSRGVAGR